MIDLYKRMKAEANYDAKRFLDMLSRMGGVATAKQLIQSEGLSDGYMHLYKKKRLDLTVEALVIQSQWQPLFTIDEMNTAQERLESLGYTIPIKESFNQKDAEGKNAYLLTWNPNNYDWYEYGFLNIVKRVKNGEALIDRWSCGNSKKLKEGDKVYMIRLGLEPKGIFASGIVTKASFEDDHWDPEKKRQDITTNYVEFQFLALLDPERDEILDRDILINDPILSKMRWDSQSSGITIKEEVVSKLEKEWEGLFKELEPLLEDTSDFFPEEIQEPEKLFEGAKAITYVNAYERNPKARKLCIDHYGTDCRVCGFDFEATYGDLGRGFIHVHHLIPLSEIGEEYIVNPIEDLRPVCPNCHAMLHRKKQVLSISELQAHLKSPD